MSEMIERVAKAIDAEVVASKKGVAAKSGQIRAILDAVPWGEQNEVYREQCRLIARAAIASMRTPTDAMLHRISGSPDAREASWLATWHDMIDGALK